MKQITPEELHSEISQGKEIQLIDVRELHEHNAFNIGGRLIPLGEIMDHASEFNTDQPIIFYCKMGIRSQIAIQRLTEKYGFSNLVNLQGGLERWKKEVGT